MCFRPGNIAMDKKCPNCGMSNGKETKACWKCGTELPTAPEVAAPSAAPTGDIPKAPEVPQAPSAPTPPHIAR